MSLFSLLRKNVDSLLAAVAGFCIILLFTSHGGIGIYPDSVVYLTTSENISAKGSLSDFSNSTMVDFPAGYPVFLSIIGRITGMSPLTFAPGLNALLFACTIFLSGYIVGKFFYPSKWYKWAILTCIVISPCLLEVYSMLWSETLFIFLLLLFVITFQKYFQTRSIKWLLVSAIITSLACITRYVGITIIATGAILLLMDTKATVGPKTRNVFLFGIISSSFFVVNIIRNHIVSGTWSGPRESSITSFQTNLHDAGTTFYGWLPFLQEYQTGATWFAALVLIVLVLMWLNFRHSNDSIPGYENITACFSAVYLLFIVIIASLSRFETLNSRLLSPVYIFLLWNISSAIITPTKKYTRPKARWLIIGIMAIVFMGFQYGQVIADAETWDGVKDAGIPGYTEDQWKYSPTVLFVQKDSLPFKTGYTIYSNANDAVYFFTRRQGKYLPHKESPGDIQSFLQDHRCYAIWFDDGENPELVDKDFLLNTKKMKLARQFEDGCIFELDN